MDTLTGFTIEAITPTKNNVTIMFVWPEVKNPTYASSLNQTLRTLHGIGRDQDIQKRKVAQNILSVDKDFIYIQYDSYGKHIFG